MTDTPSRDKAGAETRTEADAKPVTDTDTVKVKIVHLLQFLTLKQQRRKLSMSDQVTDRKAVEDKGKRQKQMQKTEALHKERDAHKMIDVFRHYVKDRGPENVRSRYTVRACF